jgi:hypothetical protein
MPDLEISLAESETDETPLAVNYLVSIMLAPHDATLREEYRDAVIFGAGFKKILSDPEWAPHDCPGDIVDIVRRVMTAPDHSVVMGKLLRGARSPSKTREGRFLFGGMIAGYAVLIPILLRFRHGIVVGRTGAFRALHQWLCIDNGMRGTRLRNLQGLWKDYHSAAHLWAAFILLEEFPENFQEFIGFLCVSEAIRDFAEQHKDLHSRETLLNPSLTWKVPANFPLPVLEVDLDHFDIPAAWVRTAMSGRE